MYYKYSNSGKNIFIELKRKQKFYVILDIFIRILIIVFVIFFLFKGISNFLIGHINENVDDNLEIIPNIIIKPVLQINDGLESKIEAFADKAFFVDKDNIYVENVIIKGNNDFVLESKKGNIDIKSGEISLIDRPITTIIN